MKILYVLIFTFSFLSICNAGTRDPSVADSKHIEYGAKHECVLPIVGVINDGMNSFFRGSCVVIDEWHILTAAHIVHDSIAQHVILKSKAYPCALVAIHGKYTHEKMGFHDIAIARLQTPIKLDFYPDLYIGKDEVGKVCSLAGYGYPGTFETGYMVNKFDNKKRAGSNIVDKITRNVLEFSVRGGRKTDMEFLICPGDSGGGLFIDQKLAGIHSYVYATDGKSNSNYADVGCSTRVSDYIDWIKDTKKLMSTIMEASNAIQ